ncbi:glyoxalase superfamily protein [Enterovibrio calviensis]|uniref:glyoxalase superfamily protein n=1 Tax=Enterovibrio calviensis TaxID=91359 RepID=UPI000486C951|nr:glyoxalase superfamily protein [Enterovibrio calviensis]
MTSKILSASDLKAFKRQAKQQRRILQCTHMQALEAIARQNGFESWHQVLKIAEHCANNQAKGEASSTQRVLLDNSLYTSVPFGWLIGRKPYSDFSLHIEDNPSVDASELEVPSSLWKIEKDG